MTAMPNINLMTAEEWEPLAQAIHAGLGSLFRHLSAIHDIPMESAMCEVLPVIVRHFAALDCEATEELLAIFQAQLADEREGRPEDMAKNTGPAMTRIMRAAALHHATKDGVAQ